MLRNERFPPHHQHYHRWWLKRETEKPPKASLILTYFTPITDSYSTINETCNLGFFQSFTPPFENQWKRRSVTTKKSKASHLRFDLCGKVEVALYITGWWCECTLTAITRRGWKKRKLETIPQNLKESVYSEQKCVDGKKRQSLTDLTKILVETSWWLAEHTLRFL